jgi:hypothetical protein
MAITNTTNEAKHGNRKPRATTSPAISRQPADAGRNGRRDSSNRPKARATSRPASDRRAAAGSRSEAGPIVELTIDLEDDQVLEAVANLLLDLTRHKYEQST